MTEQEKAFFLEAGPNLAPFIVIYLRIRKMFDNEQLDAVRRERSYKLT